MINQALLRTGWSGSWSRSRSVSGYRSRFDIQEG